MCFLELVEGSGIPQETTKKCVFDTRKSLSSLAPNTSTLPQFPSKKFELEANCKSIVLDTEVQIYDTWQLNRGESSLTLPYEISLQNSSNHNNIVFTYHLQPQVELKYVFEQ